MTEKECGAVESAQRQEDALCIVVKAADGFILVVVLAVVAG